MRLYTTEYGVSKIKNKISEEFITEIHEASNYKNESKCVLRDSLSNMTI